MDRKSPRQALRQLLGLVLVVGVVLAGAWLAAVIPADASKLRSEVSPVRSRAHEALLLLDEEPDLWRRFVEGYARQLARRAEDSERALVDLHVQPALEPSLAQARSLAAGLRRDVDSIASRGGDEPGLRMAADRLDRIDEALRR